MSATTTATPETAAGGPSTSTENPIDSLDFSDVVQTADQHTSAIPDYMLLGGERKDSEEADETTEAEVVATDATGERPALPEGYKYDSVGRVRDAKTGHVVAKDKVAEIMAAAEAQAAVRPEPFKYRTQGQTKDVEGFLQNPDGTITVAAEKAGELRQLLNARDVLGETSSYVDGLKAKNAELAQQIERTKQGGSAAEARANALIETYTNILSEPDETRAVEAFFQLRLQYPELLAKAEANHWKTVATSGRSEAQPERSTQTAERESAGPSALPPRESAIEATSDHIEQLKLDHQFRDLTPEDWKQFSDAVARKPYAYLRPATAEEAQQFGVAEGEIVFDTDALADDITSHATRSKAARETAAAQTKLAADNARRTSPTIEAPPVAGGGITPAKAPRKITNKQEMDEWWESEDL